MILSRTCIASNVCASVLALWCFTAHANAKISQATTYNYFKIQGETAREIYASLMKYARGPTGHDAYATTTFRMSAKPKFDGKSPCGLKSLELKTDFKITMPQLYSPLSNQSTHVLWRGFENTLITHELHHKSLWLACVSRFDQQAKAMDGSNCAALSSKLGSLWKAIEAQCVLQNNNFDKSEQTRLRSQPFIKYVVSTR